MPRSRKRIRQHQAPAPSAAPARKKRRPAVYALVALLGVGLGAYFGLTGASEPQYLPEDVVRAQPLYAVHEMGAGPRIPLLPKGDAQPRIDIPQESYSFGRIGSRDVVTHTFVIRNAGEGPLIISRAYTTCGCTKARITARTIPPGKVALATVRFDAGFHDTRGQTVQRGLILETNDRDNPRAEIWVHASVATL
jgi:hypothetical protein